LLFQHIKEPSMPAAQPSATPGLAIIDRDSIYWSKERWRIIPQRLGPMSIQYLLIDTYENEIVGTHAKMSDAMAQRDALDPVEVGQ
jgi:hypothetical protein